MNDAPSDWNEDGFLVENSPIIVTSRFGQNVSIAIPGNEESEESDWQLERDYTKIAFLTMAIATSIEYGTLCPHLIDYILIFSFYYHFFLILKMHTN